MKRLSLLLLCVGFLPTNYSFADEPADWKSCPPTLKGAELVKWRKSLVKKVIEDSENESLSRSGLKVVQEAIRSCFDGAVPACYSDLDYYIDGMTNQVPNVLSYQDTKDLTLKSATELPKELLARGSEDSIVIPDDILELAKKKGWKTVLYKTRSTGGFDRAPNLFMIAISTPEKDIFLQTSPHPDISDSTKNNPVPEPRNGKIHDAQNTLTVITVDKTQDPPVGQMRKLARTGERNGYQWTNNISNNSCTGCHTLPLKPIAPLGYKHVNGEEQRMSPEQEAQVDAMNYLLKQPVCWGEFKVGYKVKRLGPPISSHRLGWAPVNSNTRTDDYIKACASVVPSYTYNGFGGYKATVRQKDPSSINYRKVAEAMSCTECHDNANRGVLHEGFSREEVAFKILIDRTMPPNGTLTDDERLALYNCLQMEQADLKKEWRKSGEWMTGASCFGDQFKGNPPKNYNPAKNKPASDSSKSSKAVNQ